MDHELKLNERNFLRHVRKQIILATSRAAKDHGVKLHPSDFERAQELACNFLKGRIHEQDTAQGNIGGGEAAE